MSRLNKKVKALLAKLKRTTGETLGYYIDASSNKPYPKDKSKTRIARHEIRTEFFLTMGDVKEIGNGKTLNVLEPDKSSIPKYTMKLLDNDDSMYTGTDNNYGSFFTRRGSEGDRYYDDEYAFSSRRYNPWIVVEEGLDKYLEAIILIGEKNMKKFAAAIKAKEDKKARDQRRTRWDIRTDAERDRDLRRDRYLDRKDRERRDRERRDRERRDRERRDRELRERLRDRDLRRERDIEMSRAKDAAEAEARLRRGAKEVKRKQRKKSKKKKRVKESDSGDGGLAPTLLLGGLLGVLAVLVGMK